MTHRGRKNARHIGIVLGLLLLCCLLVLVGCGRKSSPPPDEGAPQSENQTPQPEEVVSQYTFRTRELLQSHYEKHGIDMGFESPEEYCLAANVVISHPDSLHKIEKEDGDDVYYLEAYNAFVILSKDGYIRTFFYPDSGKKYYDKQ